MKYIEAKGDSIDAAVESALLQLGMSRDDVSVEVIQQPKVVGIFFMNAKNPVAPYFAADRNIHMLNNLVILVQSTEQDESGEAEYLYAYEYINISKENALPTPTHPIIYQGRTVEEIFVEYSTVYGMDMTITNLG